MKEGVNKPIYRRKEVSQKFNLKKLLGSSPSDRQKELFYNLVIDKMQKRTTSGVDINGNEFQEYTKSYAKKKGVSVDSVDLVLSGDMLKSFEESTTRQKNMLKIKMDDAQTDKAYNHNVGDTLPERTFFGVVRDDELDEIVSRVKSDPEKKNGDQKESLSLADLRKVIEGVNIEVSSDN